jgi:hypothetical protein
MCALFQILHMLKVWFTCQEPTYVTSNENRSHKSIWRSYNGQFGVVQFVGHVSAILWIEVQIDVLAVYELRIKNQPFIQTQTYIISKLVVILFHIHVQLYYICISHQIFRIKMHYCYIFIYSPLNFIAHYYNIKMTVLIINTIKLF